MSLDIAMSQPELSPASPGEAQDCRKPSAFRSFFQGEWPRLRNYLRRFVDADDAEEIAQEAFSRVLSFKGEIRSPSGLLYQTARNILVDSKRKATIEGLQPVDETAEAVADPHASPEEQAHFRQKLESAARMLDRMPSRCRDIFLMQVIENYSYAEIAARMSISVVGVKKQLLRAFEICAAHAEAEGARPGRRGLRPKRSPGRDSKKP